jgi:hypothetical protein
MKAKMKSVARKVAKNVPVTNYYGHAANKGGMGSGVGKNPKLILGDISNLKRGKR